MVLTSLLANSGYIITNKILIKAVGVDSALMIGELCSEYNYWKEHNKLVNGCWFYSTRENIENNTGLTEYKQREAMKKLVSLKLIEVKKGGMPRKNYYKLSEENLLEICKKIHK